jgi:hypothetical protein
MHKLPAWAIVVCGTAIGAISLLILCAVLMALLGWWAGIAEPPALVLLFVRKIAGYVRRRPFRKASDRMPERSKPVIPAPPGSPPPT